MKTLAPSIEKIGLITGLITSLALIGYFMLMKALGLEQILELRFFNLIILAIGICYGIRKLKHDLHEEEFYLKGWAEGMYIAGVAVVSFAAFMSFYISYFDVRLMLHVQELINTPSINGVTIFITLLMEGMASAIAITLCAMQYFKSPGSINSEDTVKE